MLSMHGHSQQEIHTENQNLKDLSARIEKQFVKYIILWGWLYADHT